MISKTNRNWTMAINWARIMDESESVTGLTPTQLDLEAAIDMVEAETSEEELFIQEADSLEQLIINRLLKIIRKNRGKDIKKVRTPKEAAKDSPAPGLPGNVDVQIFGPNGPIGNLKDLKDMGFEIDPSMMENISKGIMDNIFGKKTRKKKDPYGSGSDEDEAPAEDEDRGSSFYT